MWIFIIIYSLFLFNILRSWWQLQYRSDIIKNLNNKLDKAREEQENLKRELAKVESYGYVEEQARDKLSMGREGETVVFLPPITPIVYPTPTPVDKSTNWQKWLKVFM